MRLEGKTAIITGGANGIGLEAVKLFTKEGANVALVDFNEEAGRLREQELQLDQVTFFQADVSNRESVDAMVQSVVAEFGGIDILVNNAGITKDATLKKMSVEDFQKVIDVNLTGVFHSTQAALPFMLEKGKGKIINTSSVAGVGGNIGQSNYSAAKAGVIGLTKTWAKELGKKGINVNAVAPGYIETDMVNTIPDMLLMQIKMITSSPRLGKPSDIANAYLFLASDESDFINGHVLNVDGGMMK
ncbi:3-oxoacyl-ACP reductase FabG [Halalkalibacter akibai]|uniref:3-oxoacyl-[acyl-carrier protein] reductase n=1 Tax=Halalkalibacter akibai (strain ATCC 43226 / DSM 21942 / CIP 109018 / JCM 9157 / 1139) TaxID=1236973 RepID=W4QQ49_HALA3|nr:3-oxoacyl-ACP reductase FabG [Halalkalibacter akibai]GAE34037.1 3-oxoacyl-[acyl-carrier protein] reductase [Halalkalibacter akibai JCM 9157]